MSVTIETAIHVNNPCTKGRYPTPFKIVHESPVPNIKRVTVKADFANGTINSV